MDGSYSKRASQVSTAPSAEESLENASLQTNASGLSEPRRTSLNSEKRRSQGLIRLSSRESQRYSQQAHGHGGELRDDSVVVAETDAKPRWANSMKVVTTARPSSRNKRASQVSLQCQPHDNGDAPSDIPNASAMSDGKKRWVYAVNVVRAARSLSRSRNAPNWESGHDSPRGKLEPNSPASEASTTIPLTATTRTSTPRSVSAVRVSSQPVQSRSLQIRPAKIFSPPCRGFYEREALEHMRSEKEVSRGLVSPRSPHKGQGVFSQPYGPAWSDPYVRGHAKSPDDAFPEGSISSCMRSPVWPRKQSEPPTSDLDVEVLHRIQVAMKAQSYVGRSGVNLRTLFARLDGDGGGELDREELRVAFRRTLRIPPETVADAELQAFMDLLDVDKSGKLSVLEIQGFLEKDLHAMTPRINKAYAINPRKPGFAPQHPLDMYDDSAARADAKAVSSSMGVGQWKAKPHPKCQILYQATVDAVKAKIRGNMYGKNCRSVLARYADQQTGMFDASTFRRLLRTGLRIPVHTISDLGLISLFDMLRGEAQEVHAVQIMSFVYPSA